MVSLISLLLAWSLTHLAQNILTTNDDKCIQHENDSGHDVKMFYIGQLSCCSCWHVIWKWTTYKEAMLNCKNPLYFPEQQIIFELQRFLDKSCNVQYLVPRIPEFMTKPRNMKSRHDPRSRSSSMKLLIWKRNPRSWASCRWSTGCSDWPLCRLQAPQSDINGLLVWCWWSMIIDHLQLYSVI